VLAVFAIHYLHTDLTEFLFGYLGSPNSAAILAFALLLLIPYAAMKVIAGNIGKASRKSVIGPIDRVLGFGFGAIKGLIVTVIGFSLVVLGYDSVWGPQGRPVWIIEARSYPFINAGSEAMVQLIHERRERLRTEEIEVDGDA
jgi:membrane protein required for colicin V production